MSERVFLDTNVLVYVFDDDSPEKQAIASALLRESAMSGRHVLSTQVLQEFYVVATRKLERPLSHEDAAAAVDAFAKLPVAPVDSGTVLAAVARAGTRQISLWDALIVQSAVESGCARLLTEDLQHGQEIDGVRIENPFPSGR